MRSGFKLGTFFALCVAAAMASCGSDESSSPAPGSGTCGNGTLDQGEVCDGTTVPSCGMATSYAMPNGTVTCDSSCQLVLTGCTGGVGGAGGGMNP